MNDLDKMMMPGNPTHFVLKGDFVGFYDRDNRCLGFRDIAYLKDETQSFIKAQADKVQKGVGRLYLDLIWKPITGIDKNPPIVLNA